MKIVGSSFQWVQVDVVDTWHHKSALQIDELSAFRSAGASFLRIADVVDQALYDMDGLGPGLVRIDGVDVAIVKDDLCIHISGRGRVILAGQEEYGSKDNDYSFQNSIFQ